MNNYCFEMIWFNVRLKIDKDDYWMIKLYNWKEFIKYKYSEYDTKWKMSFENKRKKA